MKRLFLIAALFALQLYPVAAFYQSRDSNYNIGIASVVSYTGPGDVVSGATAWGSCARVYNAALASTSTSLCDLVDTAASTVVICTLRGSSAGTVDLTGTYCTGSVTPAAKCAAATGGVCAISKVYDQIGATGGWSATTTGQPTLAFSAVNGLPGIKSINSPASSMTANGNITVAQPNTLVGVYERTTVSSNVAVISNAAGSYYIGAGATNTAIANPSGLTRTANDNAFHAEIAVSATGTNNCAFNVDGVEGTTATCSSAFSAEVTRLLRVLGVASLIGVEMEAGIWPVGLSSGQRTSMCHNMNVAYGSFTGGC